MQDNMIKNQIQRDPKHGRQACFLIGVLMALVGFGGWARGQDAVPAKEPVEQTVPVTKEGNARVPATAPKSVAGQMAAKANADNPGGKDGKTVDQMQVIAQQLDSKNETEIVAGLTAVRKAFEQTPSKASNDFVTKWSGVLDRNKRYAEIEEFAGRAILTDASKTAMVEKLQQLRVKALLDADKPQDALAQAKALYNVATMKGTADAVKLVAQCLAVANPGNRVVTDKFKQEQIEGAKVGDERKLKLEIGNLGEAKDGKKEAVTVPASSVLAGIKVDGKAYDSKIRTLVAEDYKTLAARGNLLLLADRPAEAKDDFERAYALSEDKDLVDATESLARCMKAQDGTVGRANAWVLSLRPKTPPAAPAKAPVTTPAPAEAKK